MNIFLTNWCSSLGCPSLEQVLAAFMWFLCDGNTWDNVHPSQKCGTSQSTRSICFASEFIQGRSYLTIEVIIPTFEWEVHLVIWSTSLFKFVIEVVVKTVACTPPPPPTTITWFSLRGLFPARYSKLYEMCSREEKMEGSIVTRG